MLKRTLVVFGSALALVLAPTGSAMAFQGKVSDAMCVGTCHTHPGFTDFGSWHSSHYSAPIDLTCDDCHPNGHTVPTASAPETLYWVGEACSPCHASVGILPAHTAVGVSSCGGCHPASVRKGTLTGTVGDSNGPLAGGSVTVSGMSPVLTSADGSYSVPGIPVGLCTATFAKAGYVSETVSRIVIQNRATTTRNTLLVVASAPASTSITIGTSATTAYLGTTTVLSGAVTPQSMIGANIAVYVMRPGKTYWTYSSNRTVYGLSGSSAWRYRYYFKPGMARGRYIFKAVAPAPGFPSSAGFATSTSRMTVSIRVR